jgi:hypothetical protein
LPALQKQRVEKAASIPKDKRDRSGLIGKGGEERAKRLDEVATAAESVRFQVEQAQRRRQALLALKDAADDTRKTRRRRNSLPLVFPNHHRVPGRDLAKLTHRRDMVC